MRCTGAFCCLRLLLVLMLLLLLLLLLLLPRQKPLLLQLLLLRVLYLLLLPGGKHHAPEDGLVPGTAANVSSEILEKQHFSTDSLACGCCSKTASKKSPPGGKHRVSEGRASSKTTPKNCLTCRLKSSKNNIFRQLLLPSVACGCCSKTSFEKITSRGENTVPLKDELVPKPRKKLPNVSSEILEKQHFSTDSVASGCCSKTASKKSPPGGKNTVPLKDEL